MLACQNRKDGLFEFLLKLTVQILTKLMVEILYKNKPRSIKLMPKRNGILTKSSADECKLIKIKNCSFYFPFNVAITFDKHWTHSEMSSGGHENVKIRC